MNMKKTVVAIAIIAGIGFAGLQQASARGGGWGGGYGDCPCPGYGMNYQQLDDATRTKVDAFKTETMALRKQIAMKRAEQMALMNSESPDPKAVAQVEGELFDLRAEMQKKAQDAGLPMMGMGMGMGMGGHHGMMGGHGRGRMGMGMGMGMGYGMGSPCMQQQDPNQ